MTKEEIKEWAAGLKLRIRKTGLTQEVFAELADVPLRTILSYINQPFSTPSIENHAKIESALKKMEKPDERS